MVTANAGVATTNEGKQKKQVNEKQGKSTRRGYGKKNNIRRKNNKKQVSVNFSVLGTNANGIKPKEESFYTAINHYNPSIITIQETKLSKPGTLKIPGYQVFEKVRTNQSCGGLLTAIHEDLKPLLISSGERESEIITVQVSLGPLQIRIINAYGPQEDDQKQNIFTFWQELEMEIMDAYEQNCMVIIEMDANAKVGMKYIVGDPHETSPNGRLLLEMVKRQNLIIVNAMDICKGVITRERDTKNGKEISVIDYILVSDNLSKYLIEACIDEERLYTLHRYTRTKTNNETQILSDHNWLFIKSTLMFNKSPGRIKKTFYKYRNKESMKTFMEATSNDNLLSSSLRSTGITSVNANIFFRCLKTKIRECFKKVKIKTGCPTRYGNNELQSRLKLKAELKIYINNTNCKIAKVIAENTLKETETILEEKFAEQTADIVKSQVTAMMAENGKLSHRGMWKIKQKLFPQAVDPPMAKKDSMGNLITSPNLLKKLYAETYRNRLRHRIMLPHLMDIYDLKTELWESRMSVIGNKKTPLWNMKQLNEVLKSLKNNKTSDPHSMINEVFKEGCIGSDLKEALLILVNDIKKDLKLVDFFKPADIISIYKNKGSRFDMNNDRGIFILTVFKKILDKLLYFDLYDEIDKNMSPSNIGARKKRNIRNHLLIIYGIINSVVNGNEEPVDLQIYDLVKCFDALWLDDCLNDVYDTVGASSHNDKLALLYEANQENLVSVKSTAIGQTERENMPNIVQQGGTWGPILCSNSIDTLGRKCQDRGENYYLYKGVVRILPLAMVDDLNGIAKCGLESVALNSFLTTQIEMKKLKFHVPDKQGKSKCHKIHVGGNTKYCPKLKVHGTEMESVNEDTYLGDIISGDGKNTKNIQNRIAKGQGKISSIMTLLDKICLGRFYFEVAITLRESMFINGILTNAETWYNVKKCEIEELEQLDRSLLRKILKVPISTPKESFYLELGILPIGTVIKARRIVYLHDLANLNENEMLYKFVITQWNNPTRGDWTELVKQDLKDFGLKEDITSLKKTKRNTFKRMVKSKSREYAFKELMISIAKRDGHSKLKNIKYTKLKMQDYLKDGKNRLEDTLNIFKFRTHMADFGENFKAGADVVICPLCMDHEDSQSQSFKCQWIRNSIEVAGNMEEVYNGKPSKQTIATINEITKMRKQWNGME